MQATFFRNFCLTCEHEYFQFLTGIQFTDAQHDRAAADPGFPVGWGRRAIGGCFSAKMYVKTKELDPVEGGGWRPPWIPHCRE